MADRKKYIDVQVPILGSSLRALGTLDSLNGKTIKLDLTRKLRGKGLTVTFRIFKFEKSLIAIPNRSELVRSYLRRMMRKRTDYVEDSFVTKCYDVRVIIKPFLITRKRVSRAVRKNLRNTAKDFLISYVKDKDYIDIFQELLSGTLQKALLPKLKKVYPLSFCDLRVFETKEVEKLDIQEEISRLSKDSDINSQVVSEETPTDDVLGDDVDSVDEDVEEVKGGVS